MRGIETEGYFTQKDENKDLYMEQEMMKKIQKEGFADFAEGVPNLTDAFDLEKHEPAEGLRRCLCCMDERIATGLHSAGSGILLSEKDFEELCKTAKLDSISSHRGCGAAKIFAGTERGKAFAKERGLSLDDPDAIGATWAREMAEKLDIPYIYLEPEESHHTARACYYDDTGTFNNLDGLPKGFVIGRKHMSKEACLAEVQVAKKIASGDHGFGPDFFTKENPFLLVAIGSTQEEADVLKEELENLDLGEDVVIDSFVAPKQESEIESEEILQTA